MRQRKSASVHQFADSAAASVALRRSARGASVAILWAFAVAGSGARWCTVAGTRARAGLGCVATKAWAAELGSTVATLSFSLSCFGTKLAESFAVAALKLTTVRGSLWTVAWASGASESVGRIGAWVSVAFAFAVESVSTVLSDGAGLLSFTQSIDTFEVSRALKASKVAKLVRLSLLRKASQTISVLDILDAAWNDLLVTALMATEKGARP